MNKKDCEVKNLFIREPKFVLLTESDIFFPWYLSKPPNKDTVYNFRLSRTETIKAIYERVGK